jgi:hypothetical protein
LTRRPRAAVRHTGTDRRTVTQAAPITIAAMASFYDFRMTSITGEQVDFDRFRDQVLLVVNVASR